MRSLRSLGADPSAMEKLSGVSGEIATPADSPLHDCSPCRCLCARRRSLGVVHRSRTRFLFAPCQKTNNSPIRTPTNAPDTHLLRPTLRTHTCCNRLGSGADPCTVCTASVSAARTLSSDTERDSPRAFRWKWRGADSSNGVVPTRSCRLRHTYQPSAICRTGGRAAVRVGAGEEC
jgi:hypothetical protein